MDIVLFFFNDRLGYGFFDMDLVCHLGHLRRLPGPLDAPNMALGHYGLVRQCVWSSGGAVATLGGRRRRLLDLKMKDYIDFHWIFIDFH